MIYARYQPTSGQLCIVQRAESQRWRFRSNFSVRVQRRKS